MDDNLTVSEACFKAEEINIFMNENLATNCYNLIPRNVNI